MIWYIQKINYLLLLYNSGHTSTADIYIIGSWKSSQLFEPLQTIFTRFTPRGKYLPLPNSRGILPTWANFTPRGKCVHMMNFTPRGKFAPRGKLMHINGVLDHLKMNEYTFSGNCQIILPPFRNVVCPKLKEFAPEVPEFSIGPRDYRWPMNPGNDYL